MVDIVTVRDNGINYYNEKTYKSINFKETSIVIITIIFIVISLVFGMLRMYKFEPLENLILFKRIKRNMNNWKNIVRNKSIIEAEKGKKLILGGFDDSIKNFKCYDFGDYYGALRISPISYLPEFIRKGSGDIWKINKLDNVDIGAKSFCEYIILKHNNNTLTCGMNMYNEIGYGGYFDKYHPCYNALDKIIEKN